MSSDSRTITFPVWIHLSHNCLSVLPYLMQHLVIYKWQNSCIAFSSQANPVLVNKEVFLQRYMRQTNWHSPAAPKKCASAITRGQTLEPSSESICVAAPSWSASQGCSAAFYWGTLLRSFHHEPNCQVLTIKFLPILIFPCSTISYHPDPLKEKFKKITKAFFF